MAKSKALICPYCGDTQPVGERCRACGGLFEPLSRQATHNEMGPWFIRDANRPFQPGCSYETLIKLIERGQVNKFTILRGPTTKQFWTIARRVPGVSHLLGYCHNCDASVDVGDHGCHACGVPFGAYLDRNYLGLPEIRPLPWEASHEDEERRGEVSSSRLMDFRRAAEPLGISSFASDEELRGGTLPPHPNAFSIGGGYGGAAAQMAHQGLAVSPQTFADPRLAVSRGFVAAQPDHAPTAGAALASAREVARQRRMVRILTIGLIVMVLIAGGALVMLLNQQGGTLPEAPAKTNITGETGVDSTNSQHAPAVKSTEETAAAPEQVAPETIDVEALLTQVQEQVAIGETETNSMEQRIAAYEDALRVLKEIQSDAPIDRRPSDLDERIKVVERAVHDLRLKAYFP
jgi:hypothetical protein